VRRDYLCGSMLSLAPACQVHHFQAISHQLSAALTLMRWRQGSSKAVTGTDQWSTPSPSVQPKGAPGPDILILVVGGAASPCARFVTRFARSLLF
jgi:hypothetical protein